ncbi:MAG: leucine-rich repeat domain-containing protein [Myxococcota bacterium]
MTPAERRVRELLRSGDPHHTAQAVELTGTLGDPALFANLLHGCQRLPGGGALRGNHLFAEQRGVFAPQTLANLLHLIAFAPEAALLHPTLRRGAIGKLSIRVSGPLQLPAAMDRFTALQTLTLSENRFITLPDTLARLPALETLDLGRNLLPTLPAVVCQLTSLKRLVLRYNPIKALPAAIGKLAALEHLDMSWTNLDALPVEVNRLEQLREVDFSCVRRLRRLPSPLRGLPRLAVLKLRNTYVKPTPEDIAAMPALHTLELSRGLYSSPTLTVSDARRMFLEVRPGLRLAL